MESKPQIELSVIVCTRNRAKQLAVLLQCLGLQKNIEDIRWEIVIVDNNSSDNTKEVTYAFCEGSNLRINYIFEPKIGLSYARNVGILASKGSILLFVDDDVLMPSEFLSSVLFGAKEYDDYGIFGFRVLPDWGEIKKPPFWLMFKKPFNLIQSFLPIHDLGKEVLRYPNRKAKNPIGACFLVRKEVFEKTGPFREDLGAGTDTGLCEDTEFFWHSLLNRVKILYWPYSVVYHPVEQERLTVKYLHKWYFNLGKSLYLVKYNGRLINAINENVPIQNNGVNKLIAFLNLKKPDKSFKFYLFAKLFILVSLQLLLPCFFLIKKPFYLTTLLAKTIGEVKQDFG